MTTTIASGLIVIRNAEARDVPWLLAELREFAEFYRKSWLLPDSDDAAKAVIGSYVERGPFFIAERDGSRVGLVAAFIGPHPFNPAITVLSELAWWVTPSSRATSAGWRLFDTMIRYATNRAHKIVWSLLPHSPVDPASLEKRGFVLHERSFLLEV